jgi:tetratricopeptide (TPR) repeat protein
MRYLGVFAVVLLTAPAGADHPPAKPESPATLLSGLGDHRHPVSTRNAEAQKFFDQGLILLFAFNHDEAARSFARAAELDSDLAMAYWGLALVKGPNYNLDADDKQRRAAHEVLQKALKAAENAPEAERDYVHALAGRYSDDPGADQTQLARAYKEAMGKLARKYPDDLDAATLYAESAMNLRPWKLWGPDGKPAEGTAEILTLLEGVLRRDPNHPGANHYYVHAIEASPYPERGLASAARLATVVPAAGHLLHMSAHIYMRIGDYAAAAKANEQAIAADQAYFKTRAVSGPYPMMYYSHNIAFLAAAHAFAGRSVAATQAADMLTDQVTPHVADMPMLEGFLPLRPLVLVRFNRWDELLATKPPGEKLALFRAVWHFARTRAYLAKGEAEKAGREHEDFLSAKKALPPDTKFSQWNTAADVLGIAEADLGARFALAANDRPGAVKLLRQAMHQEDALAYGEPPDWLTPVRETLGAVLLLGGDAAEAEQVFRAGLLRQPRSGRCLFGLRESLKAQKRDYAAAQVERQFQAAWQSADVKELRLEEF